MGVWIWVYECVCVIVYMEMNEWMELANSNGYLYMWSCILNLISPTSKCDTVIAFAANCRRWFPKMKVKLKANQTKIQIQITNRHIKNTDVWISTGELNMIHFGKNEEKYANEWHTRRRR